MKVNQENPTQAVLRSLSTKSCQPKTVSRHKMDIHTFENESISAKVPFFVAH